MRNVVITRTLPVVKYLIAFMLSFPAGVLAQDPTFDCMKARGSIEKMICVDRELGELDRTLSTVYSAALRKAANERPPILKAEQRGWIKGRNDCWKADDNRACVVEAYSRRIVELQARYRLVHASSPVGYVCNGNPVDEIIVTFFQTDPPSLLAERGDQTSLMFLEPSASGAKYVGRNESLWEHHGEVIVVWGYQAPEMRCRKAQGNFTVPLAGTAWELVAIQSKDDEQGTTHIAKPETFTVSFTVDGRASFLIDCNRGTTTWKVMPSQEASSGSLKFGLLATTRAMCAPGSQDQRVLRDLPQVQSYMLKDGKLYLSLMGDGGIYEWRSAKLQ
jgi:uncharacterized protein/heat shock protein HslJ